LPVQRGEKRALELPEEARKQIKSFVSKMTDETTDLVVNLTGKFVEEKKREKLKKKAETEFSPKIEEAITKAHQIGLQLREEHLRKKLEPESVKEKFYMVTDAVCGPLMPEIPKDVHAMDHLFQTCEELLRDFRFDFDYLEGTRYEAYLQGLESLIEEIKKEHKISQSWKVLDEFWHSNDAYLILQTTLQKLIKYYEFLEKDFPKIEKKHIDKYLEIYSELSGVYEKLISLISVLIRLLETNESPKYEAAREKQLSHNSLYVEKSGWKIFVSGFNRNMRNAIAHRTCKIDVIKETVEFTDRKKTFTLTFRDVQKETRELSSLLLILPHVLVSVFCLLVLSIREMLHSLSEKKT
jgi:hypothetical protein